MSCFDCEGQSGPRIHGTPCAHNGQRTVMLDGGNSSLAILECLQTQHYFTGCVAKLRYDVEAMIGKHLLPLFAAQKLQPPDHPGEGNTRPSCMLTSSFSAVSPGMPTSPYLPRDATNRGIWTSQVLFANMESVRQLPGIMRQKRPGGRHIIDRESVWVWRLLLGGIRCLGPPVREAT